MKGLWIIFGIVLLFTTTAWAGPFLVCDSPPVNEQVTSYNIYKDGILEGTFDGETLNYDLQGVTPGAYDWTAEACNVWGCEITPDPYISPLAVEAPQGLRGVQ